jgi:type IV pilus assembly protein PilB
MGDEHGDVGGGSSRPVEHDGYEIIATRRIKKNYYEVVLAQARADARALRSHGHGIAASASPAPSVITPLRRDPGTDPFAYVPIPGEGSGDFDTVPASWTEYSESSPGAPVAAAAVSLLEAPPAESAIVTEPMAPEAPADPGGADQGPPHLVDLSAGTVATPVEDEPGVEAPATEDSSHLDVGVDQYTFDQLNTATLEDAPGIRNGDHGSTSLDTDEASQHDVAPVETHDDLSVDDATAPPAVEPAFSWSDEPNDSGSSIGTIEPEVTSPPEEAVPTGFAEESAPDVVAASAAVVAEHETVAAHRRRRAETPAPRRGLFGRRRRGAADGTAPAAKVKEPKPAKVREPKPTPEPKPVKAKEPKPVKVREPKPARVREPKPAPEPKPVKAKEPKPVKVREPKPEKVREPKPAPEPKPVKAKEPKPVKVREPKPAKVREPKPVKVKEPKPPKEPKPSKVKEAPLPAVAARAGAPADKKEKRGPFGLSFPKRKKSVAAVEVAGTTALAARARANAARPRVTIDPKTGLPVHGATADDEATAALPAVPGALSGTDVARTSAKARPAPAPAHDENLVRNEFQDYLVRNNIVDDDQLDQAFKSHLDSGHSMYEALDELGFVSEEALTEAVASFYQLPRCDLPREELELAALDLVPESIAREHMVFPFRIDPEGLSVAVAEPSERLQTLLSQASGMPVVMSVAKGSDIRWAIDSNYHALVGVAELVEEFEADELPRRRQQLATAPTQDMSQVDNAPIVQVVNRILSQAMRDGASDVHIEPADDIVRVRNRVDGVLKVVLVLPSAMGIGLVSRIKIMADMNIVERRRPQDGKFTATVDGREIDVRVATVATIWGETCVLRILDKTRSVLSINDLGMAPDIHQRYSKLVRSPFGMVLCVGPTGSGKTTTLYASLTEISDSARNVMTIEDPVEYVFPSINQIQTNEAAGLTFATGLKSILRQDSDIVLVGEIRDVETAQIAVQSTLTGHFVLSSLHASDAISALTRFIDMGIESFLIASSVTAIVGQRLVRRMCTSCKTPYTPTDEEMAFYTGGGGTEKTDFFHGAGCNNCSHTGFKGRIGVYELFEITPEVKRLVVGFATEDELRDLAKKQGMRTIQDEAIALVASDVTTSAEVVRSIYSL